MKFTPDDLRRKAEHAYDPLAEFETAAMLRAGADAMEREVRAYATMKEMAGAATQARNQALEEAAQLCSDEALENTGGDYEQACNGLALAIRSLKDNADAN
ncbi:hypothetical protein V6767_20370 [Martelella sp. FLE1502]